MSYDLQKTMTVKEIIEWRLHWVLCSLWELSERAKKDEPSWNGGHTEDRISSYVASIQEARKQYNRVIWEVKTMLQIDYESELTDSLYSHEKYQALKKQFEETTELVMKIRDRFKLNEREQVKDLLSKCSLR